MTKPSCGAEFCLPGGMYNNKKRCPGSSSDDHHCVDCGALWWTDKGNSCSRCEAYWCPDWQQTFTSNVCEHLSEIYERQLDEGGLDALGKEIGKLIDSGICSTCFLSGTVDCKVEGCESNKSVFLENWIKFSKRPLEYSSADLIRDKQKLRIRMYFTRIEVPIDDSRVIECWPINTKEIRVRIGEDSEPVYIFTDTAKRTAMEIALEFAKNVIAEKLSSGFKLANTWGVLHERPARDKSPKRNKKIKK